MFLHRFPWLFEILEPSDAASRIIRGVRRNQEEIFLPEKLKPFMHFSRQVRLFLTWSNGKLLFHAGSTAHGCRKWVCIWETFLSLSAIITRFFVQAIVDVILKRCLVFYPMKIHNTILMVWQHINPNSHYIKHCPIDDTHQPDEKGHLTLAKLFATKTSWTYQ